MAVRGARDAPEIELAVNRHFGHTSNAISPWRSRYGFDVLLGQQLLARRRGELDEGALGTSPCQAICEATAWRSEEMRTGRSRRMRALSGGAENSPSIQAQIHRERVHGDDFVGQAPVSGAEPGGQMRVRGHPRAGARARGCRRRAGPTVELLVDDVARGERQQAERVTAQEDGAVAALIARQRERAREPRSGSAASRACALSVACAFMPRAEDRVQPGARHRIAAQRRHLQPEQVGAVRDASGTKASSVTVASGTCAATASRTAARGRPKSAVRGGAVPHRARAVEGGYVDDQMQICG